MRSLRALLSRATRISLATTVEAIKDGDDPKDDGKRGRGRLI